jgi:hypothetical protein
MHCLSKGVKFKVRQVCEKRMNNYCYDHYNLQFNSIISDFNKTNNDRDNVNMYTIHSLCNLSYNLMETAWNSSL